MNELALAFRANTLASIKAIVESENGEDFAIEIIDLLLDHVWTQSEMLEVIDERVN